MSLYDALFLYGLAIRDAYDETRNRSVFLDGGLVWKKMTARQFIGEIISKNNFKPNFEEFRDNRTGADE
jgi:hypothetical protein